MPLTSVSGLSGPHFAFMVPARIHVRVVFFEQALDDPADRICSGMFWLSLRGEDGKSPRGVYYTNPQNVVMAKENAAPGDRTIEGRRVYYQTSFIECSWAASLEDHLFSRALSPVKTLPSNSLWHDGDYAIRIDPFAVQLDYYDLLGIEVPS